MALLDGVVLHWKMAEESDGSAPVTRVDSHGANDLSDNNTVASAAGIIGNGANLIRANSEYLSIADNAAVSSGDVDFAWSAWVKLASKPGGFMVILSKNNGGEYNLYHDPGADRFVFGIHNGVANTLVNANNLGVPAIGTFYLIRAWHDSVANTVNIGVNDGAVDSAATTTTPLDDATALNIGAQNATLFWDGIIDEVTFRKGYLPTTAEWTQLWNAGAGLAYPFSTGSGAVSISRSRVRSIGAGGSGAGVSRSRVRSIG